MNPYFVLKEVLKRKKHQCKSVIANVSSETEALISLCEHVSYFTFQISGAEETHCKMRRNSLIIYIYIGALIVDCNLSFKKYDT